MTPVFHGVNRHPYIYERAANPDFDPDKAEETAHRQKVLKSKLRTSQSNDLTRIKQKPTYNIIQKNHKAFWVHQDDTKPTDQ